MVNLEPKQIICPKHGMIFKPHWPSGFITFSLIGLERLAQLQKFEDETNHDLENIGKVLTKKPICCRLPTQMFINILREINDTHQIWNLDTCEICRRFEPGTIYEFKNFWGKIKKIKHVCLGCVISKF